MDIVLKIIAALAGLLVVLSLFPGLSWPLKLRVLSTALLGMVALGICAWPIAAPDETGGIVSIPSLSGIFILLVISLVIGFVAYFIAWPFGSQIGVIAVPVGLAVWAVRSSNVAHAMMTMGATQQRMEFYNSLLPEPFFWLLIVAGGFIGTILAQKVLSPQSDKQKADIKLKPVSKNPVNITAAIIASSAIAFFVIGFLAKDVVFSDEKLGKITVQPSTGQIAFAAFASFALAAFIIRNYPGVSFEWAAASTTVVSVVGIILYSKIGIIEYLAEHWPANMFASPHAAILPLQMVSFGTLGAVAGFWLVESFELWRQQEQN